VALLEVDDLRTHFFTREGVVRAVDGVSFAVEKGKTLGIVGESGCGKSVTALSIMGLIPKPPAQIVSGSVLYDGRDLTKLSERKLEDVRGREIAMIFQDPMTSLNPVFTIGDQIAEALLTHNSQLKGAEAKARTIELLQSVGVPFAERRAEQYPHEFSGGMRQRAMIAMSIANNPSVLIADEPTTALDVTIQAQIVEVLQVAQQQTHAAIVLITHDLGLVAELADRVVVMYAGRVVELGDVFTIFNAPRHPYTIGLMNSLARMDIDKERLEPIPGQPPSLVSLPPGCAFHPRCVHSHGRAVCSTELPELRTVDAGPNHLSRCHFAEELAGAHPVGATSDGGP
jgi:oligopeptide/dipeptide ABC transporter ATP-binding protein